MSTPHWLNISFLSIMSKSAIAYSCQNKCFRMKYILELKIHCSFYYLPIYFPSVDFQIILRNESDLWQSSLHNHILSKYKIYNKIFRSRDLSWTIRGQYSVFAIPVNTSLSKVSVCPAEHLTNQRTVFRSRDKYWPIRAPDSPPQLCLSTANSRTWRWNSF